MHTLMKFINLEIRIAAAFVCALVFAAYHNNAAMSTKEWLRQIKSNAISCGRNESADRINDSYHASIRDRSVNRNAPVNHQQSPGKDSGNGCSHQFAGSLCETNHSKRRNERTDIGS